MIEIGYSTTGETVEMYSNDNVLYDYLLRNADYDYTMITANTEYPFDPTSVWDNDTLLLAEFKNNCNASNVNFSVVNTSELLVKRKKKSVIEPWTIVYVQTVNKPDDFKFVIYDRYAAAHTTYEYAITPLINGIQGETTIVEVYSDFDGDRLVDANVCYKNLTEVDFSHSRYNATETVNTITGKYPYLVNNSENNYEYGSYSSIFLDIECGKTDYDDDFEYRKKMVDWLTNHRAKILKRFTGENFLIKVNGDVSTDNGEHYLLPKTKFDWVEIGNWQDNNDLYMCGLSDVSPNWYTLVNSTVDTDYNNLFPENNIDTSVLRWKLLGSDGNIPSDNSLEWGLL